MAPWTDGLQRSEVPHVEVLGERPCSSSTKRHQVPSRDTSGFLRVGILLALPFFDGFAGWTQVGISGAELTFVRSFDTAALSNSPVESIAFDPESNVLLL